MISDSDGIREPVPGRPIRVSEGPRCDGDARGAVAAASGWFVLASVLPPTADMTDDDIIQAIVVEEAKTPATLGGPL